MGESLVGGLKEEVKCAEVECENLENEVDGCGIGKGGDEAEKSDEVIHEMKYCNSAENGIVKNGKECCEDGVVSKRGRKKRRLDGNEGIAGGKVEFVGRVLRSRSASKLESQKVGGGLDMVVAVSSGSMAGGCAHAETDSLDKIPKVMKTDSDDSDVVLVDTKKRKRGRPPKLKVQPESTMSDVAVEMKEKDESLKVMKTDSDDSDVFLVDTKKRKRGRPPKLKVQPESTMSDVAVETKEKDESLKMLKTNSDDSDVVQVSTVKRKRGRPPKVKVNSENTELEVTQVKVRRGRGRPPKKVAIKTNIAEVTNSKSKQGCPHKMQLGNEVHETYIPVEADSKLRQGRPQRLLVKSEASVTEGIQVNGTHGLSKTMVIKKGKKHGRFPKLWGTLRQPKICGQGRHLKIHKNTRGRKVVIDRRENASVHHAGDHGVNSKDIDPVAEKRDKGKTLHSKRVTSSIEDKISDSGNGNNGTSHTVKLHGKNEKSGRSMQKQLIREQIKDMLLSAGWTIEYRPRMGRETEYADAVYVSPQGRACWSVTLAYNVLKSQCANLDADSQNMKPGFTFEPIPEDVINMLSRTTKKKKERLAKLGLHASETEGKLNQKIKKKYKGENNSKKSSTTKHSLSKARRNPEVQTKRRRALLVRNSEKGMDGSSLFDMYPGKRMVLNWMVDTGSVPPDTSVHYRAQQQKTQRTHEGRIARDGIYCSCCSEVVTLSEFEDHAGAKSDVPSQNIYLEDGTSLLQCQLLTWNKQEESQRKGFHSVNVTCDDPNDDSCGICGNGGELLCCDGCTSTFHLDCLSIQKFPSGEWHCMYCLCKFCEQVGGVSCQSNDNGVKTVKLLTCRLCETKYHKSCIQTDHATNGAYDSSSFCGINCQEVHDKLTSLLGVKNELKDGYSWTLLHRFDVGSDSNLGEIPLKVESNSKLAVALSIMDECFLPIIDHRTGINLIHNVVYNCGSNFTRLNYSSFYTVILEKGDELISAASIRVHGDGLAEMPFIGTRHNYRRQGMCSRLLGAIENALRSLGVRKLVIPAISELLQTWTSVFSFKPLTKFERDEMRNINLLVFPCTDMLQKTITETSNEHATTLPSDMGSQEVAARELNMLDTESPVALNKGVLDQNKHLSVEGTTQISQSFSEVPCVNAGAEASEVLPKLSNKAKLARTDSSTSTSFHSADEGYVDADQPGEVIVQEPPKTVPDQECENPMQCNLMLGSGPALQCSPGTLKPCDAS